MGGEGLTLEELAARNVHGVTLEKLTQLAEKRQFYSVSDALVAAKKAKEKESKETKALRKKWAEKILKEEAKQAEDETKNTNNNNNSAVANNKVRIEVCANNGQAHPVKVLFCFPFIFFVCFEKLATQVLVVRADDEIAEIVKQAAKKIGLPFSAKTKLFDNKGAVIESVREGC